MKVLQEAIKRGKQRADLMTRALAALAETRGAQDARHQPQKIEQMHNGLGGNAWTEDAFQSTRRVSFLLDNKMATFALTYLASEQEHLRGKKRCVDISLHVGGVQFGPEELRSTSIVPVPFLSTIGGLESRIEKAIKANQSADPNNTKSKNKPSIGPSF